MHQPIYSPSQIELLIYLENEKAKTLDWIAEKPESRWACYPTTDLDHWAESGVFSVEQYKRDEMIGSLSDLSKEVYGFRMRYNYPIMTTAEMSEIHDNLLNELQDVIEQEKHVENEAIKTFEKTVSTLCTEQNINRATAIRWLMDADDSDGDDDFFCYNNDLPYGYFKEAA